MRPNFFALCTPLFLAACVPTGPNLTDRVEEELAALQGGVDAIDAATRGDRLVLLAQPSGTEAPLAIEVTPAGSVGFSVPMSACDAGATTSQVQLTDEVFVCAGPLGITALDLLDGSQLWTLPVAAEAPLTLAATSDRVLVGLAEQELLVLDDRTGQVLRRLRTEGAWLRGAADTQAGPMAFLIRYPSTLGPGMLIAQPLTATTPEGAELLEPGVPEPLTAAWEVPWSSPVGNLSLSGGSVISPEAPALLVSRDQATGTLAWQAPRLSTPWLTPLPDGLAVAGTRDDGVAYVAGLDPRTGLVTWERAWDGGGLPLGRDQSGAHALFASDEAWRVYRTTDGQLLGRGDFDGAEPLLTRVSTTAAVMVLSASRSVPVQLLPLAPIEGAGSLAPAPASPAWLTPGTTLHYELLRHSGKAPSTGRYGRLEAEELTVELTGVDGDLSFSWSLGKHDGTSILPAAARASAHEHEDAWSKSTKEATLERTSLWVSTEVLAELLEDGHTSFTDADSGGSTRLEHRGSSYVQVDLGPVDGKAERRDLPVTVAESRGSGVRYHIGTYADAPILVQAERPEYILSLTRIAPGG